ncbi:MAG: hypothetical protein HOH43_21930, partial [Candidatus Latescibacteria bacterium]|nr:hypothetical protein [Candidatus Latescibacterota bacterium]
MGTGHGTSKPLETFTFPLEMRKSAISDLGLRYWGLGAVGYLALFAIVITFASFDPFLTPPIPSYLLELSPRSSPAEAPNTRSATLAIPDWFRSTKQPIAPSRSTSIPESSASPNSDIVTSTHLEPIAGGRNRIRSSSSGRIGRQAVIEDLRSSIDGEFSVLSVKSEEASAGFSGNQSEDLMQRMDNFDGVTARTAGEQQLQTSQTGPISATVIGRSSRSVNVGKDVSSTTSQRLPTNANENLKITGVEGLNGQVVIEETMPEEMGDRPALVSRSSG